MGRRYNILHLRLGVSQGKYIRKSLVCHRRLKLDELTMKRGQLHKLGARPRSGLK